MPSSGAFVCSDFVSFVVKALSQRRTPSYTNQYAFRRSDAASNRDFEPGFEGPSGVGALDLHVLRVPPPVSPCYGEIISLLPSCSACTANFPQAIVIKMNFPAKTGPEAASSPCFLPVIREYQGESGRRAPNPGLILPSSLPSKLGWSPGDLRCVNALARLRERVGVRVKLPMRPLLHPFLVNGRSGDPALYVETLFEKGAIMFDLG